MTEQLATAELVEQPKEKKNLVFAAYVSNTREISPVWNNYGGMSPDKMKVSDNYSDQLELCKFFTNRDTIVIGVINKQVELAFNGYKPRRNNCTDEEFEVYCAVSDKLLSALKVMYFSSTSYSRISFRSIPLSSGCGMCTVSYFVPFHFPTQYRRFQF